MRSGFFTAPAQLKPNTRLVRKENTRASAVTQVLPDPEVDVGSHRHDRLPDVSSQPTDPASATAVPAALPSPPNVAAQQVAEVDPVTWQKNFDQCLLLLRGPEDEKR